MNKYLMPSKYLDFLGRKFRLYYRRTVSVGMNISLSSSANISLTSELSATSGALQIGAYSQVDRGAVIRAYDGRIEIGSFTTIGAYCCLYGGGQIRIGDGVRIGPTCSIIAANHRFSDLDTPIYLQGMCQQGIEISDDVWIGAGVTVLDGVKIGTGAVIGAGAVVSKDVPERVVVGGVPARILKSRIMDREQ